MKRTNKFIYSSFIIGATAVGFTALLSSCGNKGYNVTYHATKGFTINSQQDFVQSNVKTVKYEPAPDPDPREESKFIGWYTTNDYSTPKVSFPLNVTSNINLYARWVGDYSDAHTVMFSTNGGTAVSNTIVKNNETINVAPHTSKTDYRFKGWYESDEAENPVTFPYTVTKDSTLYARWERETYRPYFVTEGTMPEGTEKVAGVENTYRLKEGVKILKTAPYTYDDTTVNKKYFAGWYKDEAHTEKADFSIELHSDITLYADFKVGTHTITLKDDETTKVLNNVDVLPYPHAAITSHPDKIFVGWKKGETLITEYPYNVSEDTTLTAVWDDRKQVKVTYKIEGETVKERECYVNSLLNDDFTPTTGEFLEYNSFEGWSYDKSSEKLHFPIEVKNTDITLSAILKRKLFNYEIKDIETGNTIATKSKVGSIETPPKVIIAGRESDYTLNRYLYSDKATQINFPITTNNDQIKNNTIVLVAEWKTGPGDRKYRFTLDYGGYHEPYYWYPTSSVKVGDIEKMKTEDRYIAKWKDADTLKEYSDDDYLHVNKDTTLVAVWAGYYSDVTLYRYDIPSDQSKISEFEFKHFDNRLTLDSLPNAEDTTNCYKLDGYYVSSDNITYSEDVKPLSTKYDTSWRYLKEHWTLTNATVKFVYPDNSIQYKYHVGVSNFKPSDYVDKTKLPDDGDYTITGFSYMGVNKAPSESFDLVSHSAEDNEIKILCKQSKFKVSFDLNYDGATERIHEVSSCKTVPNYAPTRENFYRNGWYYDQECSEGKEVNHSKELDKDITVYCKWTHDTDHIVVKFNAGSSQLGSYIEESGQKEYEKSIILTEGTQFTDFPNAKCDGPIVFDGWYTGEGQTAERIDVLTKADLDKLTNNTLYAHWISEPGAVTVTLKVEDNGYFKQNNNNVYLATVSKNSLFGSIKDQIPEIAYPGDDFKVSGWSTTSGGATINSSYSFDHNQFLYAVAEDNIKTPSTFKDDNWATVSAVAENKIKKDDGKFYNNGKEALETIYGLSAGDTKEIMFNGDKFTVRVAGLGQDYANAKRTTKLPLTLEFTTIPVVSEFGTSDTTSAQNTWSTCSLKKKLDENGAVYNSMPLGLRKNSHIQTVYKATNEIKSWTSGSTKELTATMSANKLFIPTLYEINIPNSTRVVSSKTNIDFLYQVYKDQGSSKTSPIIRKTYGEIGYCCYWCRNTLSSAGSDCEYIRISKDADGVLVWSLASSFVTAGRGVSPFFCLGEAY